MPVLLPLLPLRHRDESVSHPLPDRDLRVCVKVQVVIQRCQQVEVIDVATQLRLLGRQRGLLPSHDRAALLARGDIARNPAHHPNETFRARQIDTCSAQAVRELCWSRMYGQPQSIQTFRR